MNPHSEINDNNKKNTKTIAAIPMAGAIVTAAILLSGLSLMGTFQQPAIAIQHLQQQEDITGTGGTMGEASTTGTNATTMGGGNATMAVGAQGNDSMLHSEVRMHIEEARTALQNNDTQEALMHLDLALNELGGASGAEMNMTNTTGGAEVGTEGGAEVGNGGGILEGIFGGGG